MSFLTDVATMSQEELVKEYKGPLHRDNYLIALALSTGFPLAGPITFSTPGTNDLLFEINGTTGIKSNVLTDADMHAFWFDYDRSALSGGRLNNGLSLGAEFSTFRETLHNPQYGITWGWNQLNKGVTVSSPGDTTKGSVIVGYNNLNGGQYNFLAGQANSALGTGGFVGGRENVVGYTSESTAKVFIATHTNSAKQVTITGDVTAQFPVAAYVGFWQTDGSTPAYSLLIVTASAFSGGATTLTFDRKANLDYNGNTSSWVMNITTAVVNAAAAFGYRNTVHGLHSFAAGLSNTIHKDAPSSAVFGSTNSITGSADGSFIGGELNSVTTGKYCFLAGYNNVNTTFGYCSAVGRENTLGGIYSNVVGYKAVTRFHGHNAQASGMITVAGDSQREWWTLRRSVQFLVAGTWYPLYVDGSGISGSLPNDCVMVLDVMVTGTATASTKRYGFGGKVVIHRTGGTYTVLAGGTLTVLYNTDDTDKTARVAGTSSTISVEVSSAAGDGITVKWAATITAVSVVK